MSKYLIDENFFEKINTPEKAYILGFLYADGCIYIHPTTSVTTFTLLELDIDILNQIKECMKSSHPLYKKVLKNNKIAYTLTFYNTKIYNDLIKLGIMLKKSLIIEFPDYIEKTLMPHFIRGYFDGDGCIWNGKRNKVIVKDLSKKSGYRKRIVHNVKFTFTGNTKFISLLLNYLIQELNLSKTKLNFSKSKNKKNICTLEYSGRKNIEKLYNYMYNNATIYGLRKNNKFKEILCAINE